MFSLIPVIAILVSGYVQADPGEGIYTELQAVTAARIRLNLADQQDIDLFDALLYDIAMYNWPATQSRVDTSVFPKLQTVVQTHIKSLLNQQIEKDLFDGLLNDLRNYKPVFKSQQSVTSAIKSISGVGVTISK